ncbi:MAG TPA: phytanoyl-CoA dioxygenase family protein [Candidatus Acidoferrum sp.]|nr:phytanoyl-CoA dioxygenase family protein [Candidatus Acidoferrum sp.]
MAAPHVEHLREHGYAVIRGFLSADEIAAVKRETDVVMTEGLKHRASYRDRNLMFEILNDPQARRRVLLQTHWFAWINPALEALRRHPRYLEIMEPMLGRDIKQVTNQLHWKPPSAKFTGYRFHQDLRFRERPEVYSNLDRTYLNTGLAVDPHGPENGGLSVYDGSHTRGYLGLSDDGPIMKGETQESELLRAGLDPAERVDLRLDPGDLVIWTLLTVHGSLPNRSGRDRCFMINSYVRAADSPARGEWVFRDGVSTPLGPEPEICKYEQLRERPGPFYIEDDWTGEALPEAELQN